MSQEAAERKPQTGRPARGLWSFSYAKRRHGSHPRARKSSAPRQHSPPGPMPHQDQPKAKARGKGSAYQGWVRNALTQPPAPIVGVSRNPSRKPALTEPVRPGARRPAHPPQPREPAARQPPQAAREARPGHAAGPAHPATRAGQPPRNASPAQARTGKTPGPQAGIPWPARHRPPRRRTPACKPGPRRSQAQHGENPGQPGSASRRSQAAVRNPRRKKQT
jgi:hypothetical protein